MRVKRDESVCMVYGMSDARPYDMLRTATATVLFVVEESFFLPLAGCGVWSSL